jgi:hypothetical protein
VFTAIANQGLIAQAATQRALAVRDAILAAQNFYAWISAQADGDLTGIGFAAGDVSLMRSMAADLNALANIYHGLAPGGSYQLPYAFANSSTMVIGSQ